MPKIVAPVNTKWERVSYIYNRLYKSDGLTISELAYELGVSTKTIQRDLHDALRDAGAICSGRKWRIDKSQAVDDLKSDERVILGILNELSKSAGRQFYAKAHNLLEQIGTQIDQSIFAVLDVESLKDEDLARFEIIEQAIKNTNLITCDYRGKSRKLKPLKLAFFEGFWYLLALDTNSDDAYKTFHLKTLNNIKISQNDMFTIDPAIYKKINEAYSAWFDLDKKSFEVRLFAEREVAVYLQRKPLKNQIILGKDKDGSIEIGINITHEMEILPFIFRYLPHIKVISPAWLNDLIKKKLNLYLEDIK